MEFWEELRNQGFVAEYDPDKRIFRYADCKDLREIVTAAAYRSLLDKACLRIEWHIEAGEHRDAFFQLPKRKLPPAEEFYPVISGNIVDKWLVQWGASKTTLGNLMANPPPLHTRCHSEKLLVYWRKAEHLPALIERLTRKR